MSWNHALKTTDKYHAFVITTYKQKNVHLLVKSLEKKKKKKRTQKRNTSFGDREAEFQDDSAEVAAEAGLVGAVDGDDGGPAGGFGRLDQNDVVAGDAHVA